MNANFSIPSQHRCWPAATLSWLAIALIVNGAEQWGVHELTLPGPNSGNPYLEVRLGAKFTHNDVTFEVPGFWDGGNEYRIRFMPPKPGEWRYETTSNQPELAGRKGAFTVTRPSPGNHGPVRPHQTHYFRYADGTPYHQFGSTCYAWVHQPQDLQEQTLKTLAASPFNKIRFCVFPKSYNYNRSDPERFAFLRGADGKFDFTRPDPVFWRQFEQRVLDLQRLGIEADLILWHPYDRWGFAEMGKDHDDRYLRYCIARLSAFRNVWWSLANEYDLMAPKAMAGHRGDKTMADWDRFFSILQQEDPSQLPRSIHNCRGFYDHTKSWVSHASLQTSDLAKGVVFRRQFGKPVVYDECKYEGNIPEGWGNLTAREMTQRFWLGTLSGCYVGHGETYKHPGDILWWSKGGGLHGESPQRIQWLKDFMAKAPPFEALQVLGDDQGRYLLAKPGEFYLLYCASTRLQTVTLAGLRPYKLDVIDPWAMTITPMGTATAGDFVITPAKADLAFRLLPYAPGEKMRPEVKITVSVAAGLPPLAVQFTGSGGARWQWDFGDGAASNNRNPTHVFQKPGLYTVTLTVTDAEGASALASTLIAVDRNPSEPLLRAGVKEGELPALKLAGTTRRQPDGTLQFPSGAPWGWAEGDVLMDARALRSFTIMGWLWPESLQTGSGGNRILFCLNRDHSGIDLVSHADGRLRLAVNQWPDAIKNDSTPGKLVPGKWTFFAVTYDCAQSRDNVSWYFSEPADNPGPAKVVLDRKATYNPGPVGTDIGPLTIGNFNQTMRGHGLDRQFRGQIRALQLFGSSASSRGALSLETINRLGF